MTEEEVLAGLDEESKSLLIRVLEIERARVHITGSDKETVDQIFNEARKIAP